MKFVDSVRPCRNGFSDCGFSIHLRRLRIITRSNGIRNSGQINGGQWRAMEGDEGDEGDEEWRVFLIPVFEFES